MVTVALSLAITVQFVENPFAVEWFAVRTGTASSVYARAMDAAKLIADDRETIVAMSSVDGLAAQVETPAALVSLLGRLPDRLEFENAKSTAQRIAEEIGKVPGGEREKLVFASAQRLTHARNLLRNELAHYPRLLDDIASDLSVALNDASVRVLLVPAAPRPGAATYRTQNGPLCVVGLLGFAEHELLEAMAHEVAHAMDDLSRDQDTLLNRLRKALAEANVPSSDPRTRDVPHAVIFAATAARVKAVKGRGYVPYGQAHGTYSRMGETAKVVNEIWAMGGTMEERIAQIVNRLGG
jgi:hypothetical protein